MEPIKLTSTGILHAGSPIHGLESRAVVTASPWLAPPTSPSVIRILFFASGEGVVTTANKEFKLNESAVLALPPGAHVAATPAAGSTLTILEFLWHLRADEAAALACSETAATSLPHWQPYESARTYREAIKSEKTTSRTLVPVNVVPRFSMGSVETTGPDAVGAHSHPMLEQLFFGLPGSEQIVTADDASCVLRGLELLHIPLGSNHGVRVNEGKKLHYLWLDFFFDQSGTSWITTMHVDNPE